MPSREAGPSTIPFAGAFSSRRSFSINQFRATVNRTKNKDQIVWIDLESSHC